MVYLNFTNYAFNPNVNFLFTKQNNLYAYYMIKEHYKINIHPLIN